MRSISHVSVIAMAVAGTTSCGRGAGDIAAEPEDVRLEHLLSSEPVPYSEDGDFAVLGRDGICFSDSYNVFLLCGDRSWRDVSRIASEGDGPGEVRPYGQLTSAPRGGLAYVGDGSARTSFFSADRTYAGSVTTPPGPVGSEVGNDSIVAIFAQPFPSTRPTQRMFRVNAFSGEVKDTIRLRFDPGLVGGDTAIITDGVLAGDGRILARISAGGEGWLAWYSPDGEFIELLDFPSFGPVYPSERDIEDYTAGYRLIFKRAPPEADVRRFTGKPLPRLPRGSAKRMLQVDSEGRAWVVTTRPSERGSFLEIFQGAEYLGALEVPGRVRGIQIVDSLLVALVEGKEPDGDGLYPRRFDWYRIHSGTSGSSETVH